MEEFGIFKVSRKLPAFVQVDVDEIITVKCENGWIFDYTFGYNGTGRILEDIVVECPPYVQGENRTMPLIAEFVCLREYFFFIIVLIFQKCQDTNNVSCF